MKERKRILIISPTPSHPQNAGNRARIYALASSIQKRGYEVHFLYWDRERHSNHVERKPDIPAMKLFWDNFVYVPLNSPNFFQRADALFHYTSGIAGKLIKKYFSELYRELKPYFPDAFSTLYPMKRKNTGLDRFYDISLDYRIKKMHAKYIYDAIMVEYVFMSRALEAVGNEVVKIIDTHDVFTNRNKKYSKKRIFEDFFSTTISEEARGIKRADIIIAIQKEEAKFLRTLTKKPVIIIGHITSLKKPQKTKVGNNIAFLGSGNKANIHGVNFFIKNIFSRIKMHLPNVRLILAGNIGHKIKAVEGCKVLGEVKNIAKFYDSADVVISPLYVGTGLKIKVVEALSYSKPIVMTSHSAEGLDRKNKAFLVADDPESFSNAVIRILTDHKLYRNLTTGAYKFSKNYQKLNKKNISTLLNMIK